MPTYFATASLGFEDLLVRELTALGAEQVQPARAGVAFSGDLEIAYRACLWSRLASRILLQLKEIPAADAEALYTGIKSINWTRHIGEGASIAVDFLGQNRAITNTQFGVQKVKDAVVDQLRDMTGERPRIDTANPDVRINVYLHDVNASVSIDLSGNSLHQRGYRSEQGEAPLKENLAAAILLRADWPQVAANGGSLADPMCGSGTLLIEGAMMVADIAPGLLRSRFGFHGWRQHEPGIWQQLLEEARNRRERGMSQLPVISGSDHDARMIRIARANVQRAGLEQYIQLTARELDACEPASNQPGLLVTNPPYGERLGEHATLPVLYRSLGLMLKRCYPGWHAAILTGDQEPVKFIGLRAHKTHTLFNGALKCRLLHCEVGEQSVTASTIAADFANRLRKNLKQRRRWAEREDIPCYRLYDADLPEYNLAIDIYGNDERYVHVQEYAPPADVDKRKAQARLNAALAVILELLEVSSNRVYFKQRQRQKEGLQYEKMGGRGEQHTVREGENYFLVNFTDYLDTGLFLDHRPIRQYLQKHAGNRRFLNLFAYTGSATVCAVRGGAVSSITVDMSRTYLDWAQKNLQLNKLEGRQHTFVQADARTWLKENSKQKFDLIFLDPPAFSRSKRMQATLDIQRDHATLIKQTMALLSKEGELIFSTNLRKFRLDSDALKQYSIEDITHQTIPEDFARNTHIHQCFRIRHGDNK